MYEGDWKNNKQDGEGIMTSSTLSDDVCFIYRDIKRHVITLTVVQRHTYTTAGGKKAECTAKAS